MPFYCLWLDNGKGINSIGIVGTKPVLRTIISKHNFLVLCVLQIKPNRTKFVLDETKSMFVLYFLYV
jgi:hypothetical protein